MQTKKSSVIAGLIVTFLGVVLLAWGVFSVVDHIKKSKTYISVTGVVVAFDVKGGYDEDLYDDYFYDDLEYAPIVEYVVNQQIYEVTHDVYSSSPEYFIGQRISLKYNPQNPEDVIFKFNNGFWIMLVIGALFTGAGVTLIITTLKKKNKSKIYNRNFNLNEK